MMSDFTSTATKKSLTVKLWRGERMCLAGMDVDQPEDDFVGFSIEVRNPGSAGFFALRNRLNFSYPTSAAEAVNGYRNFPSTEAPFQKFRWIDFPPDAAPGKYVYRVTKKHMAKNGTLTDGDAVQLDIALDPVTYSGFLDVGFTRNFASSQAYADRYGNNPAVIPAKASGGLKFHKLAGDVYPWLGFEAWDLIFGFLDAAVADPSISIDCFAYDLNEPDIVDRLTKLGPRLRAIVDDSGSHAGSSSAESQAAKRFRASAGKANVRRMHFRSLQHNKVFIAKRNGTPFQVLFGSTNFSFRGIYIQANNVLVCYAAEAAALFASAFELAFHDPAKFTADPIATQWHLVQVDGKPPLHFCFSPHSQPDLSLNPLGGAIDQATSSVLFSIAFLYQTKSGATREAIDRLMKKNVFSYGISDKSNSLVVRKPDGSIGIVDFAYLAANAPEPFKSEWSGGSGIHEHHKFVVTDFNLPTAKVFTGSSNLSPAGEKGNGDNLVMIEDPRVATAYAIEALRIFDHLHFRSRMQDAKQQPKKDPLVLFQPPSISGKAAWFAQSYESGTQKERDRLLFAH
ncbi:MAG TPA: phospholipase D-like domain-containing protein [Thermoanaerobaculia bacterium]|nr:phospholipase D-like domain-containing protein [Thermoanaerobaculia bacterium]